MYISHTRQKYNSLLISLTVHGLIVLLCLFLLNRGRERSFLLPEPLLQEKAAKVMFAPLRQAGQNASPFQSAQKTASQPNIQPGKQKKRTITKKIQRNNSNPTSPTPSVASPVPEALESPEKMGDAYSQGPAVDETAHGPGGRGNARPSGAAFMGAFRHSIETEKWEAAGGTPTSGGGSVPAHIQERVGEWQAADYITKIRKAVAKALRLYKKYVRTPIALNFEGRYTLLLDEKGKIKQLEHHEKTMVDDIDEAIDDFFNSIDFPPIPARLNMKEWPFRCTVKLKLPEGGHVFKLESYDVY